MSREIKFEFIFGNGIKKQYTLSEIVDVEDIICFAPIKHKRQYTGLLDKNGKEIYEGDIIDGPHCRYEILYSAGCFYADGIMGQMEVGDILNRINNESEIIGNVYENLELLKETE